MDLFPTQFGDRNLQKKFICMQLNESGKLLRKTGMVITREPRIIFFRKFEIYSELSVLRLFFRSSLSNKITAERTSHILAAVLTLIQVLRNLCSFNNEKYLMSAVEKF